MSDQKRPGVTSNIYSCEDGHVHIEFTDDNGEMVFGFAMDVDGAIAFVDGLDDAIECLIGDDPEEDLAPPGEAIH